MIAVPGRYVKSHGDSVFPAGVRKFFHQIAFPVAERGLPDIVVCRGGRPEAESVMMLANQNQAVQPALPACLCDFFRIEMLRRENRRIFIAVTPFLVCECVQPEMNDRITAASAVVQHTACRASSRIERLQIHDDFPPVVFSIRFSYGMPQSSLWRGNPQLSLSSF